MAGPMIAAGGAGMGALASSAALLGPVGWAALGVAAVATVVGNSAAAKQAQYDRYQMKLQANQARIEAHNTMLDLSREMRYTRGRAMAALGHGASGIGMSFVAIRNDELNLYSRNAENTQLGAAAAQAEIAANQQISRARQSNQRTLSYLDLLSQGLNAAQMSKKLSGPGGR